VSPYKLNRILKLHLNRLENRLEWLGKLYVAAIHAELWLLFIHGCG